MCFELSSVRFCVQQGTPQMTETFIDSKKEVDSQLKLTCEEFITHVTEQLVGTLQNFLSRVGIVLLVVRGFYFVFL